MDEGLREDCEAELEALEAVYFNECTVVSRWPPCVSIALAPSAEEIANQFVQMTLHLRGGEQYPNECPAIEIRQPKGLGDARHAALLGQLRAHAEECRGMPMMASITQVAQDLLTDINSPEGDCPFCIMPIVDAGGGSSRGHMKLLECFHCAHSDCFAEWWHWEQSRLGREHEEAVAQRPSAPEGQTDAAYYGDPSGPFPVRCPVCRGEVSAEDLSHIAGLLHPSAQVNAPRAGGITVAAVAQRDRSLGGSGLPEDVKRALRED
eukprot:CAMPEP_0182905342 /NCGR_PEP_ID=MMETSP0034_2-20130328/32876_1 /TAXON_ID=156128 /ORGANISM="Nephroselmis pyriformis, Strain CCMP717" /LENGTH=263 /DNA_ID=CAMNT_0025040745 /DNA_START=138 /DNA_END=926 /DNA_ORIENTATION=+